MSEFNPYREWLGIRSKSKPTYYQLLGISLGESDSEKIRRRAKAQIRRLLSIAANERTELREAIIVRIKRAAKCLIDEELRKQYDQRLLQALRDHEAEEHVEEAQAETSQIAFATEKGTGKRGIARKLKKHRKRFDVVLICGVLGAISLVGVGYLLSSQTDLLSGIVGSPQSKRALRNIATENGNATNDETIPQTDNSRIRSANSENRSVPLNDTSTDATVAESADDPSTPSPTVEELRELGRLLTTTRTALTERKIDDARRLLAQAAALARRPQDKSKYERLARLTDYVEGYWNAASDGLAQIRAGEELAMRNTRVMVVEKNDETLILRMNGQNKTYPLRNLPVPLQIVFADRWFESSAASTKVFRGAMMAVSPDFDRSEVLELWRVAQRSGDVDIGDLELVLEDTYDLVP